MALFIHLGFGLLFGYIIFTEHLILITVVAAFIFWLTDEIVRFKWKHKIENMVPIHYEM
ncbi:hypothetical protein [Aquisalibacillus elongatus]|nr:hypothetical protein [Aquisalibacillus elongatus]